MTFSLNMKKAADQACLLSRSAAFCTFLTIEAHPNPLMNPQEHQKLAELEDHLWYFRSLHAHFQRALTCAFPKDRAASVLDAGCGTGGLARRLVRHRPDWEFTGLDISPVACELARSRMSGTVLEGDLERLPFEGGEFDGVCSADALCQVEHPEKAMAEFFRVLRPGGVVILNAPACRSLYSYHDEAVGNRRRQSAAELRAMLSAAGFRGIQVTHWNTLLFPAIWVRRRFFPSKTKESDVKAPPLPIEWMLRGVMALEHAWLDLGFTLPFGLSVFVVARKPFVEERI